MVVGLFAAGRAGAQPTALQVEAPGAPQYVHGSDGRVHVEYDLIITNVFTADATLKSLEVRGDGRRLLVLRGAALAAVTRPPLGSGPTARIAPASTVVTLVDIALRPRRAGGTHARDESDPVRDPCGRSSAVADRQLRPSRHPCSAPTSAAPS